MEGRPFNLVTPRYGEDFREQVGTVKTDWRFTLDQYYGRTSHGGCLRRQQVPHGGGDRATGYPLNASLPLTLTT